MIHNLNRRTFSHLDCHRIFALRQISGVRHINRNGVLRLNRKCRSLCTAQANFFLRSKCHIYIAVARQFCQLRHDANQRHAANAVVQIRRANNIALLVRLFIIYGKITDLYQLFCFFLVRRSNVQKQIVESQLGKFGLFFKRNHAARSVLETNASIYQIAEHKSADLCKARKSLVIYVRHHNADGVHMRREQNLLAAALAMIDQIVHRVNVMIPIANILHIVRSHFADCLYRVCFSAGRAECRRQIAKCFINIKTHDSSSPKYVRKCRASASMLCISSRAATLDGE